MPDRVLTVGIVVSGFPVQEAFRREIRDHITGIAPRSIRDARSAMEETFDVLVLPQDSSMMQAALVRSLRQRGIGIVGLYDPDESPEQGREVLRQNGIDICVSGDADANELLEAVRTAQPDTRGTFEDLVSEITGEPVRRSAVTITVGGPPGSGASEVAVGLATVISEAAPTTLVDCDERRPGVARRLHRALNPNIQTLVDELRGGMSLIGEDDGTSSAQRCLAVPAADAALSSLPFSVLAGVSNPRAWAELRPEDVQFALESVRAVSGVLVADIGGDLEDLSRHGIDRTPLSRGAVEQADTIITVCEASPRGVVTFLDWCSDLAEFRFSAPTYVVLNRCPRDPSLRQALADQLTSVLGQGVIWELPEDRRVQRASWDGFPVSRGKWIRQIRSLAGVLAESLRSGGQVRQPHPGVGV